MRVKVCGITRMEDIATAVDAGADAVGFICGFPESPRNLLTSEAQVLIKKVPPFVESVLVTNAEFAAANFDQIGNASPSLLQLYGKNPITKEIRKRINSKIIRPVLIGNENPYSLEIEGYDAVLSYGTEKGLPGGTGALSDWSRCRSVRERIDPLPFILSGGLNPENVEDAISQVMPYAVDVSSGVESSPGKKDKAKTLAFVNKAKGRK